MKQKAQQLILILVLLGLFFRCTNLDRKVYWLDETFTSLRISGYTDAEAVEEVSNANLINSSFLQKYQRSNPNRGIDYTIKGLAVEEPQLAPLYFILIKYWAQCFGCSVATIRSLSAIFSLLALPSVYWLALELFDPFAAKLAVAILAISPFQLIFAQEARPTSLWTVTILLSSAALLRAMRLKTKLSWVIYTVTLSAGFYTFLLHGLIAISHGIYVGGIERWRFTKTSIAYLRALFLSTLVFTPWLLILIFNRDRAQKATEWASENKLLIKVWLVNLERIFLDFNNQSNSPLIILFLVFATIILILILIGFSIDYLCKKTPKRVYSFIILILCIPALALIIPDLVLGRNTSAASRYLTPTYLGIQLAISYLFSSKLLAINEGWKRRFWQILSALLVSGSIISCTLNYQAQAWWNKDPNSINSALASEINRSKHPLLISDGWLGDLLSLSYKLNPNVQILSKPLLYLYSAGDRWNVKQNVPNIPEGFSDVFYFNLRPYTPGAYRQWLQDIKKKQTYELEPLVSQSGTTFLWKLKNSLSR